MNEKQYLELCKLADEVLLESNATATRICIPWLHILQAHPDYVRNYEGLFLTDIGGTDLIRKCLKSIRNKLSLLKILLKSFFTPDISEWSKTLDRLSTIDILFISHLLNKTQLERRTDHYYGDLPQKLNENGHLSLTALLNQTRVLSAHFSE